MLLDDLSVFVECLFIVSVVAVVVVTRVRKSEVVRCYCFPMHGDVHTGPLKLHTFENPYY